MQIYKLFWEKATTLRNCLFNHRIHLTRHHEPLILPYLTIQQLIVALTIVGEVHVLGTLLLDEAVPFHLRLSGEQCEGRVLILEDAIHDGINTLTASLLIVAVSHVQHVNLFAHMLTSFLWVRKCVPIY